MQDQLYKITVNVSNLSNMNPSQPAGSNKLFFGYENDEGTARLDYSEGITGTTTGNYTYYVVPKTNRGNIFLGISNGGGGYFECEIGSVTVEHIVAAFQPMYSSVLSTVTDYYAFGSPMPGRNFNSPNYRYGFNGQEKDDEIAGNGNINTAEFWEYDTRLGRRWNIDPIRKSWESPYACFSGNPIYFADPRGLTSSTVTPGGGSKDFPLNKDGKAVDLEEISITPQDNTAVTKPTILYRPYQSNMVSPPTWFDRIKKFFAGIDNATIYSSPRENSLSGMEPKSKGDNKNVAGKSNAEGIETTTPEYPGAIIMGKGGVATSAVSYMKNFSEIMIVFREAGYGGVAGNDAVEYSEIKLNDPNPSLQKEADRTSGQTVIQKVNSGKVVDTIYKKVYLKDGSNYNMMITRENGTPTDTFHYAPDFRKKK